MKTSHLGLSLREPLNLCILVHCVSFHMLKIEASLLGTEGGIDLQVQQNAIGSHFILMFL